MKALVLALLLVGCGASHRRTVIGGTVAALDAAQTTLITYRHDHVEKIIHDNTDPNDARVAIVAFDAKADKVELEINAGIHLAAIAGSLTDDASLANLIAAAKTIKDDFIALEAAK